jgi:hypothetical protein
VTCRERGLSSLWPQRNGAENKGGIIGTAEKINITRKQNRKGKNKSVKYTKINMKKGSVDGKNLRKEKIEKESDNDKIKMQRNCEEGFILSMIRKM